MGLLAMGLNRALTGAAYDFVLSGYFIKIGCYISEL